MTISFMFQYNNEMLFRGSCIESYSIKNMNSTNKTIYMWELINQY
jgi:hypothetical protein